MGRDKKIIGETIAENFPNVVNCKPTDPKFNPFQAQKQGRGGWGWGSGAQLFPGLITTLIKIHDKENLRSRKKKSHMCKEQDKKETASWKNEGQLD